MTLGEFLKIMRGDRTLREMEKISGLSNAYWYQLEEGEADNPSADVLRTLIQMFPNHRDQILKAVGL